VRGSGHLRTAVVAALVGAFAAAGTVAMAGSGVGGIFNLGTANSVDNAVTKLNGTNATGSMLDVSNTSASGANANGVTGHSASADAAAVVGLTSAANGVAVKGFAASGTGVFGRSTSAVGGRFLSTTGNALLGVSAGSAPTLRAQNTGSGPAASFEVGSGTPPFTVNSSELVTGLNADLLDGLPSTAFVPSSRFGTDVNPGGTIGSGSPCILADMKLTAANKLDPSWIPASGQIMPINGNTALFSLLGVNYGGDGHTTFGLPDMRSITPNHMTSAICAYGTYPGT
jgi:hypothetical protein